MDKITKIKILLEAHKIGKIEELATNLPELILKAKNQKGWYEWEIFCIKEENLYETSEERDADYACIPSYEMSIYTLGLLIAELESMASPLY